MGKLTEKFLGEKSTRVWDRCNRWRPLCLKHPAVKYRFGIRASGRRCAASCWQQFVRDYGPLLFRMLRKEAKGRRCFFLLPDVLCDNTSLANYLGISLAGWHNGNANRRFTRHVFLTAEKGDAQLVAQSSIGSALEPPRRTVSLSLRLPKQNCGLVVKEVSQAMANLADGPSRELKLGISWLPRSRKGESAKTSGKCPYWVFGVRGK